MLKVLPWLVRSAPHNWTADPREPALLSLCALFLSLPFYALTSILAKFPAVRDRSVFRAGRGVRFRFSKCLNLNLKFGSGFEETIFWLNRTEPRTRNPPFYQDRTQRERMVGIQLQQDRMRRGSFSSSSAFGEMGPEPEPNRTLGTLIQTRKSEEADPALIKDLMSTALSCHGPVRFLSQFSWCSFALGAVFTEERLCDLSKLDPEQGLRDLSGLDAPPPPTEDEKL
ncbi:hypothetical protein B0H13DRAFT_1858958 [Mycena leptocephala]|nr:hypothetical protein B0H13DRAFT_1858958 [Mycena leptocephala]